MEVQLFNNPQFGDIRVILDGNNPLFVANDIAKSLGYTNPRKAVADHCKSRGVTKRDIPINGVNQTVTFIDEANLYRLVMRSNLPDVEPYQDWVCEEVLPSIRKNGAYLTQQKIDEVLSDPDTIIRLATQLKEERAEKERLELQNQMQETQLKLSAPKTEYFDTVLQSNSTHTTNQIAKELGMSAITLNKKLRSMGIQYLQSGQWLLSYKYQNKGYTKTRTHHYTDSLGREQTNIITVWTEIGRLQIHKWMESCLATTR